jgi:hypothetical protein
MVSHKKVKALKEINESDAEPQKSQMSTVDAEALALQPHS